MNRETDENQRLGPCLLTVWGVGARRNLLTFFKIYTLPFLSSQSILIQALPSPFCRLSCFSAHLLFSLFSGFKCRTDSEKSLHVYGQSQLCWGSPEENTCPGWDTGSACQSIPIPATEVTDPAVWQARLSEGIRVNVFAAINMTQSKTLGQSWKGKKTLMLLSENLMFSQRVRRAKTTNFHL